MSVHYEASRNRYVVRRRVPMALNRRERVEPHRRTRHTHAIPSRAARRDSYRFGNSVVLGVG